MRDADDVRRSPVEIGAFLIAIAATVVPRTSSAQHRADRAVRAPESAPATTRPRRTRAPGPEGPRAIPVLTVRGTPPPVPPCLRAPVEVRRVNGHASWTGPLTDCEGHPSLHALAAISVLASPTHFETLPDLEPIVREIRRVAPAVSWTVIDEHPRRRARTACPPGQESVVTNAPEERPQRVSHSRGAARTIRRAYCRAIEVERDAHTHDPLVVLDGRIRIVSPRLVTMLDAVTRHFAGHRVEIVSGYRPSNNPEAGSRHAHARALDYRLAGIARETLRDFAYTLPLAGVGYYPNSVFIHMDVRDSREGSARWTDYASQGESARYGHWPPRDQDVSRETDYLVTQAGRALDALRDSESAEASAPAEPAGEGAPSAVETTPAATDTTAP